MAKNNPSSSPAENTRDKLSTKKGDKNDLLKPDMGKIVPLNFRVPASFKRDFKIAAANYGITQSELLQKAFEAWQEKHS